MKAPLLFSSILIVLLNIHLYAQAPSSLNTERIVELETAMSPNSGTLVCATMERISGVYMHKSIIYRSTDNGSTWTTQYTIEPDNFEKHIADPVINVDSNGVFYVIVMRIPELHSVNGVDLELYRSFDDGISWEISSVPHPRADGFADYPQFNIGENGEIALVYSLVDFVNLSEYGIVFKKSENNGLTWSNGHFFSTGQNAGPSVTRGEDGSLYLSVNIGSPGSSQAIFYVKSTDNGDNWSVPETFPQASELDQPHVTKIFSDPNSSFLGMLSHEPHQALANIIFHHSNNGIDWTSSYLDEGAYAQAHITNDGIIHIVYNKKINDEYALLYRHSSDGGESFTAPTQLYSGPFTSGGTGEYQSLLMGSDGLFYLTFCDWADESKAKILQFAPAFSIGTNTESQELGRIDPYPNPTHGKVFLEPQDFRGIEYLTISTLDGVLLSHIELDSNCQVEIDLTEYPTGTYLMSTFEKNRILVKRIIKQ